MIPVICVRLATAEFAGNGSVPSMRRMKPGIAALLNRERREERVESGDLGRSIETCANVSFQTETLLAQLLVRVRLAHL